MITVDWLAFITALGAVGYGTYSFMKLKEIEARMVALHIDLEEQILSPEEMAKEVVKVKLPLSDIPQEVKDRLREFTNKMQQKQEHDESSVQPVDSSFFKKNKSDYIG